MQNGLLAQHYSYRGTCFFSNRPATGRARRARRRPERAVAPRRPPPGGLREAENGSEGLLRASEGHPESDEDHSGNRAGMVAGRVSAGAQLGLRSHKRREHADYHRDHCGLLFNDSSYTSRVVAGAAFVMWTQGMQDFPHLAGRRAAARAAVRFAAAGGGEGPDACGSACVALCQNPGRPVTRP